jgi:hypothetical protein
MELEAVFEVFRIRLEDVECGLTSTLDDFVRLAG